jgi:hypothetical protein
VTLLDGHYRHRDVSLVWDDVGLSFARSVNSTTSHVDWSAVEGVRQIGARPGFVQLIVRDHIPPGAPEHDPFSIPVASDADANRLVTAITWRVLRPTRGSVLDRFRRLARP